MSSIKIKRIESEMIKCISDILANEASDSLLKTITITGCEVASDLSFAKVYFTSLTKMAEQALEKELNEASGYIRTELAERIDLRHTPKLRFVYDNSIAYGNKIEKILKEINEENNNNESIN